ncbi:MAG: hypothetical protein WBA22_04260 [Candidatus Methanofastidiosia archaeon]
MAIIFRVEDYKDILDENNLYYILMKSSSQLGTVYAIPSGNHPIRSYRKEITFMESTTIPFLEEMGVQLIKVSNVVFEGDRMIVRLDNPEDLKFFYRDFFLTGEKYNYTYIASLIFSPPVIFSFSGPHRTTREYGKKLEEEGYKVIRGEI